MISIEALLREAGNLPLRGRFRLAELLLQETASQLDSDETAAGERGLVAWTESTRREDWSEFYPRSLQNGESR